MVRSLGAMLVSDLSSHLKLQQQRFLEPGGLLGICARMRVCVCLYIECVNIVLDFWSISLDRPAPKVHVNLKHRTNLHINISNLVLKPVPWF